MDTEEIFYCKKFQVRQEDNVMKVNSDGMLLGAWVSIDGKKNILDIGTGTGIIALMLAQRTSDAKITGIEIDEASAREASYNFNNCTWHDRLHVIHEAIQDFARSTDERFDLIVSNPPFFSGGTFSANENKAQVRHTVKLSHGDLLIAVHRLLAPGGRFELILPYLEGERLIDLAARYDLFEARVTELRPAMDKPIERLLISLSRERKENKERDTMVMCDRTVPKTYHQDYIKLTADFYLKF